MTTVVIADRKTQDVEPGSVLDRVEHRRNQNPQLELIRSQSQRIRALEKDLIQTSADKVKAVGDLEGRLFQMAKEKAELASRLSDSLELLRQAQGTLEALEKKEVLSHQQIQEGLKEIQLLNQQMVEERRRVQGYQEEVALLQSQYAAALAKMDGLNGRIHELERLQREILQTVKQQREPSWVSSALEIVGGSLWRALNGWDPKLYQ